MRHILILAFASIDANSVDTYTFRISGNVPPSVTHRGAREPSDDAVGPLLRRVELRRFESLDAWFVIFNDGSTATFGLIGDIYYAPHALPAGWTFLDSFTWGGGFYLALVRSDFSALSFWKLSTDGQLVLVRKIAQRPNLLSISTLSISGLLAGYEFSSIYVSGGDVIIIRLLISSLSRSDPMYSRDLEVTHEAVMPLRRDACGRLSVTQLFATCKLF